MKTTLIAGCHPQSFCFSRSSMETKNHALSASPPMTLQLLDPSPYPDLRRTALNIPILCRPFKLSFAFQVLSIWCLQPCYLRNQFCVTKRLLKRLQICQVFCFQLKTSQQEAMNHQIENLAPHRLVGPSTRLQAGSAW